MWKGLLAQYPETAFRAVVIEDLRTDAEKAALAREKAKQTAAEEAARRQKQAEAGTAKTKTEQDAIAEAKRKAEELRQYNTDRANYWDTLTTWLRHSGKDSTGVGMDWIKVEDLSYKSSTNAPTSQPRAPASGRRFLNVQPSCRNAKVFHCTLRLASGPAIGFAQRP